MFPMTSNLCHICDQPAHGNHFGAISCRACAAFFRRANMAIRQRKTCQKLDCEIFDGERYKCKDCRLRKCVKAGMDKNKIQPSRDVALREVKTNITPSFEKFVGRPHFILFCTQKSSPTFKNFFDCSYLIEKAAQVLKNPSEPDFNLSQLQRLKLGFDEIRCDTKEVKIMSTMDKKDAIWLWENGFLLAAKWLTSFDAVREMPHDFQMELLKTIWHIFGRLPSFSLTAKYKKLNLCNGINQFMISDKIVVDMKRTVFDVSWATQYDINDIRYFLDEHSGWQMTDVVAKLEELEPTDVELTFMMAQLSFQYAGKRCQGNMIEATDRFQEILSNDLHNYYTARNIPRYSNRLAKLLAVNNQIQKQLWEHRQRLELAAVFDIFCIEFSHMEMFKDMFF